MQQPFIWYDVFISCFYKVLKWTMMTSSPIGFWVNILLFNIWSCRAWCRRLLSPVPGFCIGCSVGNVGSSGCDRLVQVHLRWSFHWIRRLLSGLIISPSLDQLAKSVCCSSSRSRGGGCCACDHLVEIHLCSSCINQSEIIASNAQLKIWPLCPAYFGWPRFSCCPSNIFFSVLSCAHSVVYFWWS